MDVGVSRTHYQRDIQAEFPVLGVWLSISRQFKSVRCTVRFFYAHSGVFWFYGKIEIWKINLPKILNPLESGNIYA